MPANNSHSCPIVFLDRRMLIQILYYKIQDKSKVITSERVVTVKNGPSYVAATTKTGKSYTGDKVVGTIL
jgi:protoporphyrinogen oxidase